MEKETVVVCLSLAILDLGVIVLLRVALSGINIRSVLREKDADSQPPGTKAIAENPVQAVAGDDSQSQGDPALDNTSYSRVAGFIGAVVMACFLWALGNILLFDAINSPTTITTLLSSMSTYFLTGSALFAPYAFNQVSKVFKPG
jgi:hypothetical protein